MKTNTEIRMAAQSLYRQLVSAHHNDRYGEDDGSLNILLCRMMNAVKWAKENGEYNTMKSVCNQMFNTCEVLRYDADNIFNTIFE